MSMRTSEIRQTFLDFFSARGHTVVPSSSLVPADDPTLLFTNAGMVQFKDVFLGTEARPYNRAVSSQRCVRAGGKHNDLENVGYTARHHTFFEMLGNFSFGDYFKHEAIAYAWELLTEQFGLAPERLWVTVFDDDDESADIWLKEVGVSAERFSRCGAKDNFWSMGETGPCGPCSEIFYDHGPEIAGGPPGSSDEDGDRYIEIWNLVFMQYNRDAKGNLEPLPKPSVDTGMGLERLAAVLQGKHNNYEIDLFRDLIESTGDVTGVLARDNQSLRVIADHIRSCAFLVADGVIPSNEGRGYVLRRIIRRAIRHGHKLGAEGAFFHRLVAPLAKEMGDAFPDLREQGVLVEKVLLQEEERFAETLEQGMRMLDQAMAELNGKTLSGETIFRLYDTYGFPTDLTADVARERGLKLDMAGFEKEMESQRERARAASRFGDSVTPLLECTEESEFIGYEKLVGKSLVTALYVDGVAAEVMRPEDHGLVVLERTPFYAESGGQVGDHGLLKARGVRFKVTDTQRQARAVVHAGVLTDGELRVGDELKASVYREQRLATARNHSATHLLHAALRKVLGSHVSQKGSRVGPDRLRFDFSHFEPVSSDQLQAIEQQVNHWILENSEVATVLMSRDEAMESGAQALFGEKYDEVVRVLSIGEHSTELCGGTHVSRAGDIGLFKLTGETGVAAGVRRIEAVTANEALAWVTETESCQARLAAMLKSDTDSLEDKFEQILVRNHEMEKELARIKARMASNQGEQLAGQAVEVGGIKVLAAIFEGEDRNALRNTVDQLKNKLGTAAVVLAAVSGDKLSLVAGVTADATDRVQAGPLVNHVAKQVGGKGGGRPDMAQAGGSQPANIDKALASVRDWVEKQLAS